ncbi:hypothetical protein [Nonomuraea aurantiaca]|uniref:hypothetical protein n=1 Tax=Nonomuraea aurantiaca TaxID=2878562 RepID=UPI001CD9946D|nr:hypothetical protein [Nonomuraea aurantiaca]MCA2225141.1 hypothetical protein [Nonomuraea aurantiaca]
MLSEALAALAAAGGTALVSAMSTDAWTAAKQGFARLLGRGEPEQQDVVEQRLERSRRELAGKSDAALERARADQEAAWRLRLSDLLEDDPAVEADLRALVTALGARAPGSSGQVRQQVLGFDHAQQAVQGHGVQNVSFGGGEENRLGEQSDERS